MNSLLIGLGSSHGIDQLGWLLIDELENFEVGPSVSLFKSNGSGTDWFHEIRNQQQVIFLDAAYSNEPLGSLIQLSYNDLKSFNSNLSSTTHSISLIDSIDIAQNLNILTTPIRVFAISIGHDKEPGELCSFRRKNIKPIADEILAAISQQKQ